MTLLGVMKLLVLRWNGQTGRMDPNADTDGGTGLDVITKIYLKIVV